MGAFSHCNRKNGSPSWARRSGGTFEGFVCVGVENRAVRVNGEWKPVRATNNLLEGFRFEKDSIARWCWCGKLVCRWSSVEIGYRDSSLQAWPPGPVQCFVLFGKKTGEKWIKVDPRGPIEVPEEKDLCVAWKDCEI